VAVFVAVLDCGRFGLWPFWMYTVRYDWKYMLSEQVLSDRMASWKESVLAANAKKQVVRAK